MKKRNMLTKVAALSMAALMTVTGLPVAGLDGALSVEAASSATAGVFNLRYKVDGGTNKYVASGSTETESLRVGQTLEIDGIREENVVTNSTVTVITPAVASATTALASGTSPATAFVMASTGSAAIKNTNSGDVATLSVAVAPAKATDVNTLVVKVTGENNGVVETGAIIEKGSTKTANLGLQSINDDATVAIEKLQVGSGYLDISNEDYDVYVDGKLSTTKNITAAGTYDIRIKGKGNKLEADTIKEFKVTIKKNSLSNKSDWTESDTLKDAKYVDFLVNGSEISGVTTLLKGAGTKISSDVEVTTDDVDITYENNKKVGTGKMILTAKASSEFEGKYTVEFNIGGRALNETNIALIDPKDDSHPWNLPNQLYTGSQIKPSFELYDKEALTDYNDSRYATAYEPDSSVKMSDGEHAKRYVKLTSSDYTIAYGENKQSGAEKGEIVVTGKGNYLSSTSVTLQFDIVDKAKDISNAKVTMTYEGNTLANAGNVTYTGSNIVLDSTTVEWTDSDGVITPLASGTDYVVTYDNNKDVGTATVNIKGYGSYAGTVSKTFKITAKDIGEKDVLSDFTIPAQDYSGVAKTPSIKGQVVVGGITLDEGKNYSVYYDNNINAGEKAAVTIQGNGNYTGKVVKYFTINPKDISGVDFEDVQSMVYTGSELTPDVIGTITIGDGSKYTLVNDKDYKLTYKDNIGNSDSSYDTATIDIEGKNNYTGSTSVNFTIVPATNDLSKANITLVDSAVEYDGNYHSAVIDTVKVGDVTLDNNEFELVKPVSEKEADTYTVQIKGTTTGTNYYGGIGETTFTINAKEAAVDFKLSATSKTYNGKAQSVTVSDVTRDGVAIEADDYEVTGTTKATAAGKKTVTVKLTGNYSGSASKTWTIKKASNPIKVSPTSKSFKVKALKKAKKTFTIKATKAQGKVTYKSSSKKVTVSSKGKVTVKKGTKKGTYKITVKAAGNSNYNAASKTVTIKVK